MSEAGTTQTNKLSNFLAELGQKAYALRTRGDKWKGSLGVEQDINVMSGLPQHLLANP